VTAMQRIDTQALYYAAHRGARLRAYGTWRFT
jgi:hypothetical protein